MAVAQAVLSDTRRAVLEAFCDTIVPAVDADTHDPVEKEYMGRAASDLDVAAQIEEIEAVGGLLDAFAAEGFVEASTEARTQILHAFRDQDPEAKLGIHQLKAL